MLDLDMTNEQRSEVLDLLKSHEGAVLMAEIAREFIFRIVEIDCNYHEEIMEMFDAKIELSELSDAHCYADETLRLLKEKQELDKSLVAAVSGFIKKKLHDFSEWE